MIEKVVEWFVWLVGGLPQIGGEPAASVQAYSAATQTILTFTLAPITIFAAWMARNAWVAARHQREDALMPLLTVMLRTDEDKEDSVTGPNLRLRNVGVGPALNVRAEIVAPGSSGIRYLRDNVRTDEPNSLLIPVNETRNLYFSEARLREADLEHQTWAKTLELPLSADIREDYGRRRAAVANEIEPHAVPVTLYLSYWDVYRRRFVMTVPLIPSDERDYYGARRFILGPANYSIPGDKGSVPFRSQWRRRQK